MESNVNGTNIQTNIDADGCWGWNKQTFNLNPSGDKDNKSKQGFWKVASNCPMYHTDTYNISNYNVCTSLNGDVPTITTIPRVGHV
jgi:hypothetical protein